MTPKSKVKRVPKRGHYDAETIYRILDQEFVCHVGFVHEGYPVVIPTSFGRNGDWIYLHGSTASRMMKDLGQEIDLCLTVTRVHGLVLAKSAFHHSMNYESVVIFGKGKWVTDPEEKIAGLKCLSDHIIQGRWEEVREPSAKELKGTALLSFQISDASAKIRTGPPGDDAADEVLPIWRGVIRYEEQMSVETEEEGELPPSVVAYLGDQVEG